MGATDNVAQCTKRRRIGAAVILNGVISKELNALGQDCETTGARSEVTALREAVSETTRLRRSIVAVGKQNAANVNGPNRDSRMAFADTDTVAAVNRIGSDRGVGG